MITNLLPKHLHSSIYTAIKVIKSGNRIGLLQLFLYALSVLIIPIDYALSFFQQYMMKKRSSKGLPVIFISGYSRSGTTLIYQVLSRVWDVEYFNNLLILFNRSYILANYIFRKFNSAKPRVFNSFYGLSWGLSGTNDGAQLFYRWLDKRKFINGEDISSDTLERMKDFLETHEYYFQKPLLTKNCNNYLLFEQYAKSFPNAYFIFVKRAPEKVIKSTLKAREFIQGDSSIEWEFSVKETREGNNEENPVEEIALNLKYCYDKIDYCKKYIPKERLIIINYEDFCCKPKEVIDDLTKKIFKSTVNIDEVENELRNVKVSSGPPLETSEQEEISTVVKKIF
ncbi:MAG: sulfotransferase [Nitrospinae bacterium]|nr:sulfotransferase [Nitrospinota bacterium]